MNPQTSFPIFQNPDSEGGSFDWLTPSDTGVVCLHGFTATTVEVRTFAQGLHQAGFNVAGPLLPGHGGTPDALNRVTWQDWYKAAETAYLQMQERCRNVHLAGESTGALLSLLLAAKYPRIKGLILFSPGLVIHGIWKTRLLWPFKQYINKKNINLDSPWQGFNVIPLHGASELSRLQGRTRRILKRVIVPMIVFQGKLDQTIDPLSSQIILENVASQDTELVWLEESPHVILLEGPVQDVIELSIEFIASHQ